MRKCCVVNCQNDDTFKNIRFFSVKAEPDWIKVINRGNDWKPKKSNVICCRHFKDADIVGRKLRKNAKPFQSKNIGEFNIIIHILFTV